MNTFDRSFDASRAAPFAFGPTVGIFALHKASAIPSASGSSGPITANSTFSFFAIFTAASIKESSFVSGRSFGLILRHFVSKSVPPFPGTQITSSIFEL